MTNLNTNPGSTVDPRAFQALQGTPLPAGLAADNLLANSPAAPQPPVPPGAFDVRALRLGQDFGATLGVTRVITTIPVRKPDKKTFVRVHPGEDYRLTTYLLETGGLQREIYLVDPSLWEALAAELRPVNLCTAITRPGDLFVWPLNLPSPDGRPNAWNDSALAAAKQAETAWCRMHANMHLGAYDLMVAPPNSPLPEPVWPDLSFQAILDIAFRGRFITTPDHPVVLQLRGLA